MCLGIPMQIVAIDGYNARCTAKGVMREVSLFMLQDESVAVNDYVIVHVGYAIQKMTEQEAHSTWELLDELVAAEVGEQNRLGAD
jgi:hydrogenase expression/formation protein HypC